MKTEKEVLLDALSKTHGKTKEELQGLLYEKLEGSEELTLKKDSVDIIANLDAERVTSLKTNLNTEWETKLEKVKTDQFGMGKKEGLKALEKSLVDEFEIEAGDKKGMDLIKSIIAARTKTTLSADDIKKLPAYIELESRIENDFVPKSKYDEEVKKYNDYISNAERSKKLKIAREAALKVFRDCKPKLSEDANKRASQEDMFSKVWIDGLNLDTTNPNDIFLLNDDNTRKEDSHGNRITLESYVKTITPANYDILVQGAGGGSGNNNGSNSGGGSATKVPETVEEFNDIRATLTGKDLFDFHNKYCEKFGMQVL